ncbi:MAG: MFS transporter, partial [Acutalibacteraceae bacterium]|nr:MFS transporter [Acutalibacteraceae bacterium]
MSKEKVKEKMQDTFLSKKELWAFAIGGAGQGMIYAMMSSYISDYYVNILQLPLMFVLLLMLLARVWDAINDPLMGIIADKRTTKRGKLKPYILYATMPIAIFTVLMYLSPDLPKTYLMIYSAIVYVGWGMLYTMADVPFWGLPNILTPNSEERSQVLSIGKTVNGVGSAIPEVLFLVCGLTLPKILDTSDPLAFNKQKYLIIALITVIIGSVLYVRTYFKVKERVIIPPKKREPGQPLTIKRIFTCKPLMLVILMGVLSSGRYMVQAAALHVARYAFYIGPELTADMTLAERTALIDASVSSIKTIFQV